jgi:signal peptidase II
MQATRGAPLGEGSGSDGTPGTGAADHPRTRRRRILLLCGVAIVVLAMDAISKALVVATLSHRPPVRLLGGFLTLTETRNAGAAFGIGAGATALFTVIAAGVVIVIARTARRLASRWWAVVLGLLLGGAVGNLADRIFRAPGPFRGHVVDWIQLPHWPVFNVADAAITVGAVLAILLAVFGVSLDGRRHPASRSASPPGNSAAGPEGGAGTPRQLDGAAPGRDGG